MFSSFRIVVFPFIPPFISFSLYLQSTHPSPLPFHPLNFISCSTFQCPALARTCRSSTLYAPHLASSSLSLPHLLHSFSSSTSSPFSLLGRYLSHMSPSHTFTSVTFQFSMANLALPNLFTPSFFLLLLLRSTSQPASPSSPLTCLPPTRSSN